MGHTLTDNRHRLIANALVTTADGHAERETAKAMIHDAKQAAGDPQASITLGADKGYDAQEFIDASMRKSCKNHEKTAKIAHATEASGASQRSFLWLLRLIFALITKKMKIKACRALGPMRIGLLVSP